MKFDFSKVTRLLSKVGRVIKDISPELAIVGGTVGLVAAGVIACKETPKAVKVIDEHKEKMAKVEEAEKGGVTEVGEDYSIEDAKHDKSIIFTQDGIALAKVYAPALILAVLSVTAIFAGGKIFRKRVTALTSAYALLESRFSRYRDGVIEKFGDDIDKELRYKITKALVEEKKTDENGNEVTETKEIKKTAYNGYSDYARFFDESNPNWVKDGARNLSFIQARQQWANDKLRGRGFLFLNEVYADLDMEPTPEGQLVGWVYDPENHDIDNFVDFGITDIIKNKAKFAQVMRDEERSFLLDFNCDGKIIDRFTKFNRG